MWGKYSTFPIRPYSDQVLENNKKRKKYEKTYVKKSAFFVKSKVNVEKIQHTKSFFLRIIKI